MGEEKESKEEEDRRVEEEKQRQVEEEQKARLDASKLAVIFVINPGDPKSRELGERVKKLCQMAGARCGLVPSPDMLVRSLAHFANAVAGRRVTDSEVEVEAE